MSVNESGDEQLFVFTRLHWLHSGHNHLESLSNGHWSFISAHTRYLTEMAAASSSPFAIENFTAFRSVISLLLILRISVSSCNNEAGGSAAAKRICVSSATLQGENTIWRSCLTTSRELQTHFLSCFVRFWTLHLLRCLFIPGQKAYCKVNCNTDISVETFSLFRQTFTTFE